MREPQTGIVRPYAAPVGGLQTSSALAEMDPRAALVLDNWVAYKDKVTLRKGSSDFADIPEGVETLAAYNVASGSALFAFSDTGVYDVTGGGSVSVADFASTAGIWSTVQFATSAIDALVCVNGADDMRYYDGAAWNTVASLGTTDTDTLNLVSTYAQRLFFGIKNTLNVWYLAAGAVTGAGTIFRLNQVFPLGGVLAGINTWSVDGGSGLDDHIAFLTTAGEVAVYKGTDPSDATKWTRVGVYNIGAPLGPRPMAKVGGDLWILTRGGIVSLARAMRSGQLTQRDLVSYPFQPTFEAARALTPVSTLGWEIVPFLDEGLIVVGTSTFSTEGAQFVRQTGSGSWSRFTGWPATCFCVFGSSLYYGDADGNIVKAYTGTSDNGSWIVGEILSAYNYFESRGRKKQIKLLRPIFSSDQNFSYRLGISSDFLRTGYTSSEGVNSLSPAVWDTAVWDTAVWGGDDYVIAPWRHVSNKPARAHALRLAVQTKLATPSLLSVEYLYSLAGVL